MTTKDDRAASSKKKPGPGDARGAYRWSLTDIAKTFGLDRSKLDAYARKSGLKQQMLKISGTYYADDALAEELVRLCSASFEIERLRKSVPAKPPAAKSAAAKPPAAKPSRKKLRPACDNEAREKVARGDKSVVVSCGRLGELEADGLLGTLRKPPSSEETAYREKVETAIERAEDDLDEAKAYLDFARQAVDKAYRSVAEASNLVQTSDMPYIPAHIEGYADLSVYREEVEKELARLEAQTVRLELILAQLDSALPTA